ncbi:MAG TPA: DUF6252 family protein [Sunxiuqinia sp.]|nr:DUF6252 family protein [Sunxiuqinia sp.]
MKRTFTQLTTLLLVSFLILAQTSCKKDSSPSGSSGEIKLNIDGTAWEASLAVQATYNNNVLVIGGSDGNSQQVMLTIMNPSAGETYDFGGLGNTSYIGQWSASLGQTETYSTFAFQSKSGQISISKLTESLAEGTFSFKAKNTAGNMVNVLNGSFSVNF